MSEETAPSALYEHCYTVYTAMKERAQYEPIGPEDTSQGLVYEGYLTKLIAELGLSVPYYTATTRALKQMGCITQLRRGGSSSPSRWLLSGPPTVESFEVHAEPKRYKAPKNYDQRINDLNERINVLEGKVEILMDWWLENVHT